MARMRTVALLVACCVVPVLRAQQPEPFWPGVTLDPAVPTLRQVVGFEPGADAVTHVETEQYLQALAAAAPDRMRLVEYGRSWEGRRLWYAVVSSPGHIARLPEIQQAMQQLADPRTLDHGAADRLLGSVPAVAWLAYSVHGDEASCTDAALALLHHLLAARGDAMVDAILADTVVVVDPLQNPDGRERFVFSHRQNRGPFPDPDPSAAERVQPWPGGRPNHYLFDMNRDWFAMTQRETRARVQAFLQWMPLVYVDLHEMSGNSTYYFAPPALPLNPEITATQRASLERFGRNNAKWFDRFGIDYFTREEFDSFYPGYGEGWPTFHGAIGMTYEQAGVRGLVLRREDESRLTFREAVRNHFVASLSTLESVAANKSLLLRDFLEFRRSAVAEGENGAVRAFVFPDRGDRTRLARLVNLLTDQGIEVHRATGELSVAAAAPLVGGTAAPQRFPAGSYVVSLAQPAKRLATVLLSKHIDMDEGFLKEQAERQRRRQDLEFYDLTGWSLPLLFDVECWTTASAPEGARERLAPGAAATGVSAPPAATVAYLVPWDGNGSAALVADLLQQGIRIRSLNKPFRIGGTDYPRGSCVIRTNGNPADLHARVSAAALRHGVQLGATDTSWVESGVSFGSNEGHVLRKPRVAMAWDTPMGANSAGWTRYLLEQRYGVPVTKIRTAQLARADLKHFDVVVLPESIGLGRVLGRDGAERLAGWVRAGGVLVAMGSSTRWLTDEGVKLLATSAEDLQKPKAKGEKEPAQPAASGEAPKSAEPTAEAKQDPKPGKDDMPFDYEKAIQPEKEPPPRTPGAIVRAVVDAEHWLGSGYGPTANVVHESSDIYSPVKLDQGTNVVVYGKEDALWLSGFLWPETKRQMAQKAWLVHQPAGRGHVIAFAEDPNVRAFADGLNLFFLNAVLLAPGR
ncbi:MAG: hypothetical protein RL148_680 [Planctomycetota bacterium]|jgi:hypothetical protein